LTDGRTDRQMSTARVSSNGVRCALKRKGREGTGVNTREIKFWVRHWVALDGIVYECSGIVIADADVKSVTAPTSIIYI